MGSALCSQAYRTLTTKSEAILRRILIVGHSRPNLQGQYLGDMRNNPPDIAVAPFTGSVD
jgi:hypothetical protein